MPRFITTLALCACAALSIAPATQAATPVKKTKTVCKKKVVRTASGKKKTVKRCYKKKVAKPASATPAPASSTPTPAPAAAPEVPAPTGIRADLRECANKERAKVGLGPLKDNPVLDAAAQAHVIDMKVRNFFAHENLDGKSPFDRIDALFKGDNPFSWMGENIAMGFDDAWDTCEGWMNSPGHKANILRPQFDSIGTGWIDGYAAQEFGGK